MMTPNKDSTTLFQAPNPVFADLLTSIEKRVDEIQKSLQEDGLDPFSALSIQTVYRICSTGFSAMGMSIRPSLMEGDDSCPNIVYHNRKLSRTLSIDVSADGQSIEIWQASPDETSLSHKGTFSLEELHKAFHWVNPPENRFRDLAA